MNGISIILIAVAVLLAGYLFYGRFLAKKWGIDENAVTPAYELCDNNDYVPSDRSLVFGHQFASIAGAGPINGPIQAAIFGWVPILVWLLFGAVFFGAVQDFSAMYASVKNKGRSVGYIIELYIGKTGKKLFLTFTWLFSVLVIAAFSDIVSKTFDGISGTVDVNLAGAHVSMISLSFIVFAVLLGVVLRKTDFSSWINSVIAVLFLIASIVIGMRCPIFLSSKGWQIVIFVYVSLACVLPVWLLLQPRDFLNSFLLIAMIAAAVLGIIVANPEMKLDAFSGFKVNGQALFPSLFITVSCGAISGFHALVSSGTAAKQIRSEKDMLPVSFGAMLLESLLAVIALVAVGSKFGSEEVASAGTPSVVFASAVSTFLTTLHIPEDISFSLITLSVSAFALTSLDSVARVGRTSWQEMFLDSSIEDDQIKGFRKLMTNEYSATVITLIPAYLLSKMGYSSIWPLFGASSQLLGVLSLIACAVYLQKTKRQGAFLWIPMSFMLCTTLVSLVLTIRNCVVTILGGAAGINKAGLLVQTAFGIAIFILGLIVSDKGFRKLREENS